jgi:hypothetical protein
MSYSLGKKLTLIGFGGAALFRFIQLVFSLIFPEGPLASLFYFCSILVFPALAALGFLVMWLCKRDFIDLVTGGAVGVSALLALAAFLFNIPVAGTVLGILLTIIGSLYYLVLALRAKSNAPLLALLLICAFIYTLGIDIFIGTELYFRLSFKFPGWLLSIVFALGSIVCHTLCFLQAKSEE